MSSSLWRLELMVAQYEREDPRMRLLQGRPKGGTLAVSSLLEQHLAIAQIGFESE